MNENVALRSDGTWIGIDVDAYNGKVGDRTIAKLEDRLGELPVTISSTARGQWLPNGLENPSRQHFYRVPAGLKFLTKLDLDVEIIQASHRYTVTAPSRHPITGGRYVLYGYDGEPLDDFPFLDDLEALPEAWLNFLTIPEGDLPDREGFDGSVQEWLDACKKGAPSILVQMVLRSIPKEPFGHDTLISLQASLVNLGAQGESGVPGALEALRSEWLRGEYNTPEYARDYNLGISGAITKFGAIEPQPEDALSVDQAEAFGRVRDEKFLDAWIALPAVVTPDSLVERIRYILSMALASDLTVVEAAALAWHSPARRELGMPDAEALELVWTEAHAMQAAPIAAERQFTVEPEAPTVEELAVDRAVKLLTPAEEAALQGITWWGDGKNPDHFMAVMASVNSVMSEQYYHLNRWMILSLVFANRAVFRKENGTIIPLNLYGMVFGPSSTGKSESLSIVKLLMGKFFLGMDSPDIGGSASSAGLKKALRERGDKTSFFRTDEADSLLRKWSDDKGAFSDMKQTVTDLYGGEVSGSQTITGGGEGSKRVYLSIHMSGIDEEMADSLESRDWVTGFMNRFVIARGFEKPLSDEDLLIRLDGSGPAGSPAMKHYTQWVASFQMRGNQIPAGPDGEPARMSLDEDVRLRDGELGKKFRTMQMNSPHRRELTPTLSRMRTNILKCAALVALSEGRTTVKMSDYLIALEQGEEWVENSIWLIGETYRSRRDREAERIADFIRSNGGKVKKAEIHKKFPGNERHVNGLIRELLEQGKAEELNLGANIRPMILLTEGA